MHTYSNALLTEMNNDNTPKKQTLQKVLLVLVTIAVSFFEESLSAYLPYIIVAAMFFGFFIERILPICIYVPIMAFNIEMGILQYAVIGILVLSCFVSYAERDKSVKGSINWTVFLFVCFFIAVSTYFGYKANPTTGVMTVFAIFNFCCFCYIFKDEKAKLIEFSLFVAGIAMILFTLRQIISGDATYLWGTRLTFEESVRTLANAIAFSIYFAFCKLAITKDENSTLKSKILYLAIFIVGAYVLLMTYSRGVLLSVGLACVIAILFTLKKISIKHVVGIAALVIFVVYWIGTLEIDKTLMGNDVSGGSGRFALWEYFTKDMFQGGFMRAVFGYGPGEFTRISQNSPFTGLYAHSLFMDALFSFGLLGFIYLISLVVKTAKKALTTKNAYVIGLTALTVLMYISHGNSLNYQFYLMLGLCFALATPKENTPEDESCQEDINE